MVRLIRIVLAVVVGLALIVFAIVNRQPVEVSFAPFPASLDAPLFAVALVFLLLGVLAGGIAAWLGAARTRRDNRQLRRRVEALDTQVRALQRQLAEAEAQQRAATTTATATPAPALAAPPTAPPATAVGVPAAQRNREREPQPLLATAGGRA